MHRSTRIALAWITSVALLCTGCGGDSDSAETTSSDTAPSGGLATEERRALEGELQELLDDWLEQTDAPGAQLAVTDGDETISVATGNAVIDPPRAMTTDDQLRIASATKPMVAAAALQLVEEGTIDLDETIDAWFDDLPLADEITVQMLLQHTSGIPDYLDSDAYDALEDGPDQPWPHDGVLDAVLDLPRAFDPGERHDYSNSNYHLLGLIVEDETGDPLLDVIARDVFEPAGTGSIGLDDGSGANPADVPGYDADGADRSAIEYAPKSAWRTAGWADGAGIASAAELARWGWAYLASDAVLEAETRSLVTRLADDHPDGAGPGIFATDIAGTDEPALFHSGGDPGYESLLVYFPDLGIAAAVTANAESADDSLDPFDTARSAAEALRDAT